MPKVLICVAVLALFVMTAKAVDLDVIVTVTSVNHGGFVEFKAESDQKGEKATGHIKPGSDGKPVSVTKHWSMGNSKQNTWFWWDTLDSDADLKITMTGDAGVAVVLFEGHCAHKGKGEQQVIKTFTGPTVGPGADGEVHNRDNGDFGPFLSPNRNGSITHIKNAGAAPRDAIDLAVVADSANGYAVRNGQGQLVVKNKNVGNLDAPASTTVVRFNNSEPQSLDTKPLPAGATTELQFTIPPGCFNPDCGFSIEADAKHQLAEPDKTNNKAGGAFVG